MNPDATRMQRLLLWLALLGSAVHFVDNVWFFADYPEPAWLTPSLVAALWIPIAALTFRADRCLASGHTERAHLLVHGAVGGHFVSLGHYLFAAPADIAPRINAAIALQVGLAGVLLAFTLRRQLRECPASLPRAGRVWLENLAMLTVAVMVLEHFWPSRFASWWWEWAS